MTWLRVQLLVDGARELGFAAVAARVETAWQAVATAMRVADEQYGYFDETIGASARRSQRASHRRTGWTIVTARLDFDPMALLFGQRSLVYLVMPAPRERGQGRSGVAVHRPRAARPCRAAPARARPGCAADS